jgi:hypothetical protein
MGGPQRELQSARSQKMSWRNWEPTLKEILSDPIVEALMQADDVDADELDTMLGEIAGRLRAAGGDGRVPTGIATPCCEQSPVA